MQAWQQVKVRNDQSAYHGVAGVVIRVEKQEDVEIVHVRLDADGAPMETFDPAELDILG